MADYYVIATNIGEAKMANALALGIPLAITELALGDGEGDGSRGTPVPNPEATALVSERRRAPLNSFSVDPDNDNVLLAEQVIPETEGGWWIREMGLFDEDGDLIFVCNTPPTYKPQLSEGSGRTQVVRMASIVSDTAAVTLKVDPSVVLATRDYADSLVIGLREELEPEINRRVIRAGSFAELDAINSPQDGWQALVSGVPFKRNSVTWQPSLGFVTPQVYGGESSPGFDSAGSINEALANHPKVYVPAGVWEIGSALRITSNKTLDFHPPT
ncbi:MAG: phage tail protein, partial [Pseudohongiella sp.]